MSATLVSSNTTIKIERSVIQNSFTSRQNTGTTTTRHISCQSDEYAIITMFAFQHEWPAAAGGAGSTTMRIGPAGYDITNNHTVALESFPTVGQQTFYLGPDKYIEEIVTINTATAVPVGVRIRFTAVIFKNTP